MYASVFLEEVPVTVTVMVECFEFLAKSLLQQAFLLVEQLLQCKALSSQSSMTKAPL